MGQHFNSHNNATEGAASGGGKWWGNRVGPSRHTLANRQYNTYWATRQIIEEQLLRYVIRHTPRHSQMAALQQIRARRRRCHYDVDGHADIQVQYVTPATEPRLPATPHEEGRHS